MMKNKLNKKPISFKPPIVKSKQNGLEAFHAYDWYYSFLKKHLKHVEKVFLVPCAATKPIHQSPMHRSIYQKYIKKYGQDQSVLVVSEPVVLIRYQDLSVEESYFCYDFPPKFLNSDSRELFVERLKILEGKDISGCLPSHHANLITEAIGSGWKNYWKGDLYQMMKKASRLSHFEKNNARP